MNTAGGPRELNGPHAVSASTAISTGKNGVETPMMIIVFEKVVCLIY